MFQKWTGLAHDMTDSYCICLHANVGCSGTVFKALVL